MGIFGSKYEELCKKLSSSEFDAATVMKELKCEVKESPSGVEWYHVAAAVIIIVAWIAQLWWAIKRLEELGDRGENTKNERWAYGFGITFIYAGLLLALVSLVITQRKEFWSWTEKTLPKLIGGSILLIMAGGLILMGAILGNR